jgi:hypothetical protein
MNGVELNELITSVNGGEEIEITLATSLVNIGKTILEGERDWRPLKRTDTSISFSAGTVWTTPYSLAGITRFLRFQNCDFPVKVFNGSNQTEYYRQVPWEDRLAYKDTNNTFVYDEANNRIYFNGVHSLGGTLYIEYVVDTDAIDLTSTTNIRTAGAFPFPDRYHDILAFYAVGISKGAIDYDEINREMLPSNQAVLVSIKGAMTRWDAEKQISEVAMNDPYRGANSEFQPNRINING